MGETGRLRQFFILFFTFFKIGAFTIGGGYAMLPIIEREFVTRRKWVSSSEMVDIIAIVQSLPGVIAFNTSMFVGYRTAGIPGAVAAALGMMAPSVLIITGFSYVYVSVADNIHVQAAFRGIRSGVTALIGIAGFKLARKVVTSPFAAVLAALSFIAVGLFDLHAALAVLCAATVGGILFLLHRREGA